MAKRKKAISTVDKLVCALCLDYGRRDAAIAARSATRRTETEFRYYNFKIYDAAAEIVGDLLAPTYIDEIGREVGYAKSAVDLVSEATYKKYKRLVKENIAKKLHLVD